MDLSKFLSKGQMQPEEPRLSKEDYAALKKAEREELWARVDTQAQEVFRDDESMKGFRISWQTVPRRAPGIF